MKIKLKLTELNHLEKNPRKITDENLLKLRRDLVKDPSFLEKRPLLVNKIDGKYVVYAGNMRLRAARAEGWEDIWCDVDENLNERVMRERVLRDNVEYGETDYEVLAEDWADLVVELDLPELELLVKEESVVEDDFELPKEAKYKVLRGEVFKLGNHRLMCGSSTEEGDVLKLLGEDTIQVIHTDPPYGVDYKSKKLGGIMNDTLQGDSLYQFIYDAFDIAKGYVSADAAIYCWYEDKYRNIIQSALQEAGFEYKQNLIWNKGMNLSGADYQKAHENLLYLQVVGQRAKWLGERDKKTILGQRRKDFLNMTKQDLITMVISMQSQATVWDIDRDIVTTYEHPTQKPVKLAAQAILNSSEQDENIYDAFGGSGSTLIACEQLDRKCYMMELDPYYVSVIIERWEKLTNQQHKKL